MYLEFPDGGSKQIEKPKRNYHELAEAIRQGCKLRPQQQFNDYLGVNTACALGAAQIFVGIPPKYNDKGIPVVNRRAIQKYFNLYGFKNGILLCRIMWRNDITQQTREEIADWLDTF
jgi:hypothetical protein